MNGALRCRHPVTAIMLMSVFPELQQDRFPALLHVPLKPLTSPNHATDLPASSPLEIIDHCLFWRSRPPCILHLHCAACITRKTGVSCLAALAGLRGLHNPGLSPKYISVLIAYYSVNNRIRSRPTHPSLNSLSATDWHAHQPPTQTRPFSRSIDVGPKVRQTPRPSRQPSAEFIFCGMWRGQTLQHSTYSVRNQVFLSLLQKCRKQPKTATKNKNKNKQKARKRL